MGKGWRGEGWGLEDHTSGPIYYPSGLFLKDEVVKATVSLRGRLQLIIQHMTLTASRTVCA